MPLIDAALRQIKPTTKGYKLFDGGRVYQHVSLAGGKQKALSFGAYPALSLKEARKQREEAKAELLVDVV